MRLVIGIHPARTVTRVTITPSMPSCFHAVRNPRPCYPIEALPEAPTEAYPTESRFGGAPWLSLVSPESIRRPPQSLGGPALLIVQVALDDLPEPPAIPSQMVQVFGVATPGSLRLLDVFVRRIDLDPLRGHLARFERPEDSRCRPIRFEPAILDPVSVHDPWFGDTSLGRPLETDKALGNPVVVYSPHEGDLGICDDCGRPLELLLHLEGRQQVPYPFGDVGWLVVGACREHIWNLTVATHQVP